MQSAKCWPVVEPSMCLNSDKELIYIGPSHGALWYHGCWSTLINTLRQRQNGHDIFKYIFLNENVWISLKISLKCVPKVRIKNIPALVQIMAWRRPGDKPLSEPMLVSWRIYASLGLNELSLFTGCTKSSPEPILPYCLKHILHNEIWIQLSFLSRKCIWECLQNGSHFVQVSIIRMEFHQLFRLNLHKLQWQKSTVLHFNQYMPQ